eukprot:6200163-Pleurochrysis_carterae.AAC.1
MHRKQHLPLLLLSSRDCASTAVDMLVSLVWQLLTLELPFGGQSLPELARQARASTHCFSASRMTPIRESCFEA